MMIWEFQENLEGLESKRFFEGRNKMSKDAHNKLQLQRKTQLNHCR